MRRNCQRCGAPLNRGQARFCSRACVKGPRTEFVCSVCGSKGYSRGMCNTHYAAWLKVTRPHVKKAANARALEYYYAKPWAQWSEAKKERFRSSSRGNQKRYRDELRDSYIRYIYNVPRYAAASVLDMFRAYSALQRTLKELREKQD